MPATLPQKTKMPTMPLLTKIGCTRSRFLGKKVCRPEHKGHGHPFLPCIFVSLQPNGGPRWFSPPEGFYGVTAAKAAVQNAIPVQAAIQSVIPVQAAVSVIPAKAGIQNFKAEGFYGVTAAKAAVQKSEVV